LWYEKELCLVGHKDLRCRINGL